MDRIQQIALLGRVIGASMVTIGHEIVKVSNAVNEVAGSFEKVATREDEDLEF